MTSQSHLFSLSSSFTDITTTKDEMISLSYFCYLLYLPTYTMTHLECKFWENDSNVSLIQINFLQAYSLSKT